MIHGVNALLHDFCTLYPTEPIVFYNTFHIKHFLIIYFTVILSLCKIFNKVLLLFSPYCNKYRAYFRYFISICTNDFLKPLSFFKFSAFHQSFRKSGQLSFRFHDCFRFAYLNTGSASGAFRTVYHMDIP